MAQPTAEGSIWTLDARLRPDGEKGILSCSLTAYEAYDFQAAYNALYNFCTVTLSARYFDIIKDRLYILAPRSEARRSAQTALYRIADSLTRLLSPILVFTADEAWENMPGRDVISVHIAEFPVFKGGGKTELASTWERIFSTSNRLSSAASQSSL